MRQAEVLIGLGRRDCEDLGIGELAELGRRAVAAKPALGLQDPLLLDARVQAPALQSSEGPLGSQTMASNSSALQRAATARSSAGHGPR